MKCRKVFEKFAQKNEILVKILCYRIHVASKMKRILLKYQDRISKEKFDIGRINGIEYKIRMKPGVKPIHHKVKNLPQIQKIK